MTVLEDYCAAFDGLRPENRHRLPAVEWLLSPGDRSSGRTTLMAMAFVRACVESGTWVDVFDHVPGRNTEMNLRNAIVRMFPTSGATFSSGRLHVDPVPAVPVRESIDFTDDCLKVFSADFMATARTLVRAGVDVEVLVSAVRECLVRDVMTT